MKKDRGECRILECTKEHVLGGKCVLGISGWTILVSCLLGRLKGLGGEREEEARPARP